MRVPGHSRWQRPRGGGQALHNLSAGVKTHRDLGQETPMRLKLPRQNRLVVLTWQANAVSTMDD
eukprot:1270575-Prorocentrum_lima.AAC.1